MAFRPWKQNSVAGWTKWLAVIMIPFSVVFFQTWLNTQTIKRDYKMADLNTRIRELQQTLDALRLEIARLQNMDRIEMEAPDMGLVQPNPEQIQVIEIEAPLAPTQQPDSPPDLLVAKPGSPAGSDMNKEERCTTGMAISQTPPQDAIVRLRRFIAGVFASCFGRS